MEFALNDDQVDLQQTVSRLFADRFPLDAVADREGIALDRDGWRAMAEVGIQGLMAEPEVGGSGLGVMEAALVFEQVGSHLVSGPLLWSVLATPALDDVSFGSVSSGSISSGSVRDGVIDGSTILTGFEMAGAETGEAGAGAGAGAGILVEHATDADLIVALGADSVALHRTDATGAIQPLDPLDPLTAVALVGELGPATLIGDRTAAARMHLVGTVLAAAELVGVSSRALEVARDYALEREQFGVPIGSFQAVKHMLADMYVRTTLAQSATYAAAAVVDAALAEGSVDARASAGAASGTDDPVLTAGAAKLLAAEAAIEGASTAVQVLGGMGFTWDMLPNHLLKRAWHVSHRFGTGDDHATRIGADLVGAPR